MASSITRFDIEKFWKNDFGLWKIKMRALMVQQGCDATLETLPVDMEASEKAGLMKSDTYVTYIVAIVLRKLCGDIGVWEGILDNGGCSGDSEFKELKKRTEGTKEEIGDGLYVRGRSDHLGKAHSGRSSQFKSNGGTGKLKCLICHSEGHLKRDYPMKKSSGFVKKGKHDQDSDSSDDEGNTYFGEALVIVENDEMTELVMDSGGSYHMTHMRDFLYDFKVVDGGSVQVKRILNSLILFKRWRVILLNSRWVRISDQRFLGYDDKDQEKELFGFKQLGHKKVGTKQLGPSVETGVHGVEVKKCVWFEVELQGAQRDREAEVFQVSNDDAAVTQRRLEDKQFKEKTNTDCLAKKHEKVHLGKKVGANIMITGVLGQEGAESNVAENKKVNESIVRFRKFR
ncbi:hypothetical protein Tco_1561028 [Tanacetum coccineum]